VAYANAAAKEVRVVSGGAKKTGILRMLKAPKRPTIDIFFTLGWIADPSGKCGLKLRPDPRK
jgi:hypothetical protein